MGLFTQRVYLFLFMLLASRGTIVLYSSPTNHILLFDEP